MRRPVLLLLAALGAACRRGAPAQAVLAADDATPAKAHPVASGSTSASTSASASIPRTIATPPCTASPRITWEKAPADLLACSPMRVATPAGEPVTIEVAPGTPVKLRLAAKDGGGAFKGVFRGTGLPKGAVLDPKTGVFSWVATATPDPVDVGLAAIGEPGAECATAGFAIRVVTTPLTRDHLLRWTYFEPLRDAELKRIDAGASADWLDGESPEMHSARVAADAAAADAARKAYWDAFKCGHLPGGPRTTVDVDGDGLEDAVFALKGFLRAKPHSFVILATKTGWSVVGPVLGTQDATTVDGHLLFTSTDYAENMGRADLSWIRDGSVRSHQFGGSASASLSFVTDTKGRVVGARFSGPDGAEEVTWSDGEFVKK